MAYPARVVRLRTTVKGAPGGIRGAGMPLTANAAYLKGDVDLASSIVFGDGVRCVGGTLILGSKSNFNGASQYPGAGDLSLSVRGNTPIGSGETAYHQTMYRNPDANFCPPSTLNITNGVILVW